MNIGRKEWVLRGASNVKQTYTNTHTHSDTRDTQDGWSLGQGPDVILTHVGVAPTN